MLILLLDKWFCFRPSQMTLEKNIYIFVGKYFVFVVICYFSILDQSLDSNGSASSMQNFKRKLPVRSTSPEFGNEDSAAMDSDQSDILIGIVLICNVLIVLIGIVLICNLLIVLIGIVLIGIVINLSCL